MLEGAFCHPNWGYMNSLSCAENIKLFKFECVYAYMYQIRMNQKNEIIIQITSLLEWCWCRCERPDNPQKVNYWQCHSGQSRQLWIRPKFLPKCSHWCGWQTCVHKRDKMRRWKVNTWIYTCEGEPQPGQDLRAVTPEIEFELPVAAFDYLSGYVCGSVGFAKHEVLWWAEWRRSDYLKWVSLTIFYSLGGIQLVPAEECCLEEHYVAVATDFF